jgi:hypothetical protein
VTGGVSSQPKNENWAPNRGPFSFCGTGARGCLQALGLMGRKIPPLCDEIFGRRLNCAASVCFDGSFGPIFCTFERFTRWLPAATDRSHSNLEGALCQKFEDECFTSRSEAISIFVPPRDSHLSSNLLHPPGQVCGSRMIELPFWTKKSGNFSPNHPQPRREPCDESEEAWLKSVKAFQTSWYTWALSQQARLSRRQRGMDHF